MKRSNTSTFYTNDHPEVVVIAEETIIKGIDILRGMEKGGTLIVNTSRPVDDILKFIPNANLLGTIATVDADAISGVRTVDFFWLGRPVLIPPVSGKGIASPLCGAIAKVTGMIKKENLAKVRQRCLRYGNGDTMKSRSRS